jgi:thiol-disulfide isomerase/thioredoxin
MGTGMVLMGSLLATGCDRSDHPGQIGRPAPEFAISDGHTSVDLAHLRGQVVVLNFWASWCAPCVEELPSLEALHHELPDLKVVAVSTDDDSSAYQSFLLQHHVDLTTVQDAAQSSNAKFGTFRYPETYIIDKNGIVRRKLIGPQEFTSPELLDYFKKLQG